MLGTGNNLSRGVATASPDVTPLQQCLPLERIDHSFGVSHLKPPAQVGKDELKCIKETVQNGSRNARDGAKMLCESIFKLDKYKEAINSKNLAKMGSQIHRNPHDPMNHRLDDRAKSVTLNKRICTSVADQRSATTSRHKMFTDKDVNSLQAVNGSYARIEEKTRRLLAGGEGLDNKIKKKRSVGAVGNRVSMKSLPRISGTNKLDASFEPINSDGSTVLKSEHETASLPRDRLAVLEQNLLGKGSNKPSIQQNKSVGSPNTVTKGKVSRAPRTSSVMALDSFPSTRPSLVFQTSEQPTGLNKVVVARMALNPKHPASAGSPIYPMAQWVGQRPHKNSRTRRTNLVSPVSTEPQNSSPGLATSDFSARTSSMLVNGVDNKSPKSRVDLVDVFTTSPKVGSLVFPLKKNKIPTIEIGDGLKRHGRSGRGSSLARPGIGRSREKDQYKKGRPPSKTLKDCKALTRLRPKPSNGSSDFTGESDDDHEEFYLAATAAHNASSLACSSAFWKKMEFFLHLDAKELRESLSQIFGNEFNRLGIVDGGGNCFGKRQDDLCGRFDTGSTEKDNPLYQRVLSALIVEGKKNSLQYASDDSHCGSCNQIDIEPKDKGRMESEVESKLVSSHRKTAYWTDFPRTRSNEQWRVDDDFIHSDVGIVIEICSNDLGHFPTSNCQYQSMGFNDRLLLELQSIGLYPEILPDLTEGEDKGRDEERWKIEQVAMDQLIHMVYRKQMALRGSNAPTSYVRKVSKQVALACVKHTLTRCWKFEESGIRNNDTKSIDGVRSGTASNEALHQAELRGSGMSSVISCALKRYESHCDNLDIRLLEGFHGSVLRAEGKKREVLIDDVGSASSRVRRIRTQIV
ncbi:hypothetical protein UlMin_012417 [Ulmus minor]